MFTPKWKSDALMLVKGAKKFLSYKRDLLTPERVAEIESRRQDLRLAIRSKDRPKVDEASKQLRAACENSLPHQKPLGWFEENVEVMFVAIVIALGLRAYYLQPFRIPTGSMQPTLNGIIGTPIAKKDWPSFPVRMWQKAVRGRSYVHEVNSKDRQIVGLDDTQFMHFFSRSEMRFSDGSKLRLPAPMTPLKSLGLDETVSNARQNNMMIAAGTVIAEGAIDSGDLVLVDKFSYHFRKPKRGEVFVFNTIDIDGLIKRNGPEGPGSHFIKRLCGVPGDSISINPPDLLVNGKVASEPGIQKVIQAQNAYRIHPSGYVYARADDQYYNSKVKPRQYLSGPADTLTLAAEAPVGMREYAALGDNSSNSLDSRYWGPVKEFNLVGPALFSLWPISTGHWGFIR